MSNLKDEVDLAILAGGYGSRINQFLNGQPKPMMKIGKLNFLQILLNKICKYNIRKIYILCGYRGHKIIKKYHKKKINFIDIECILEKNKLDTGGAIAQLKNKIKNDLIVLNGDTYVDLNLNKLINFRVNKYEVGIILKNNTKTYSQKLNKLAIKDGVVVENSNGKFMNAGIYKFNKYTIKELKDGKFSLENDYLNKKIQDKKCKGYKTNVFLLDIGTPQDFIKAQKIIPKYLTKPAIFLDRDGTINFDTGYLCDFKKLKIKNGIIKGLKYLLNKNIYIFIVTNQAGLAKKKFTKKQFYIFNKQFKNFFINKGIYFDDVQYCFFHKDSKIKIYKKNSLFRKPGNLMIKHIKKNWYINTKKSFMIGDQPTDEICAKNSNLYFEYIEDNFYKQAMRISNYLKI